MRRRPGYTLLEVLLAIGIGLLLVAALYVALEVQMRYMQSGRQIVYEAQLARGVLNRVGADVRAQLALLPTSASLAAMQMQVDAAAGTSTSSSTSSSSSSSSSSGTGGSVSGSASGSSTETAVEDPTQAAQVNFGVIGDEFSLTLFTTASPRYSLYESQQQLSYCDLRRISYSFAPGQGLARQESRMVLGAGLGEGDAPMEFIAPEVTDLHFRYFDGAGGGWTTQWDGTYQGPPLAIEIVVTIQPPLETMTGRFANRQPTTHRLVVAVPTAAILPAPTATATDTSGSSSSNSTGSGGTSP